MGKMNILILNASERAENVLKGNKCAELLS